MKNYSIVHINTFLKGGAFIAALRLQKGLLDIGIESNLIGLSGVYKGEKVTAFPKWQALRIKISRKLKIPLWKEGRNERMIPAGANYDLYTFPTSSINLLQHPFVKSADLIHLHWVNNFLDYPSFFQNIDKPIVWTLHDSNLIRGGFHLEYDEVRNRDFFQILEKHIIQVKQNALSEIERINIVTPSNWLREKVTSHPFYSKFPVNHIFNSIDLDLFCPLSITEARQMLGLPLNKQIFIFVSEHLGNYWKGIDLLIRVVESFTERNDLLFYAIGDNFSRQDLKNVIELGFIREEQRLALIYAAADAVILPSREDNLPNIMLESMACGTPVIAFPIGGIPEVVKTGHTGVLAAEVSSEALKSAVLTFADKKIVLDRDQIRAFAEQNFDLEKQAAKYLEIYEQLLGLSD